MPDPMASTERVIADRYEVGDLLGRGGMAEVFAGTDRRLGRPVAVKLLLPDMAARPEIRSRFEAEARAAASFSHPNAVAVFDTGEHEGVSYIVMERLPGETLADRIAGGPVDPTWLTARAREVLGALAAAHAVGLIHRDVKPGNILLTSDGSAKVADFGIAKGAEAADGGDLTATGQLLGTPAYLAPERLDGSPADARSDLWALGVVLYEALVGSKPFGGSTALATARAVAAGEHRALSDVRPDLDPALCATVERAMAHDPTGRFASAADMAAALASPASIAAAVDTTVDASAGDHTMVLDNDDAAAPSADGATTLPNAAAAGAFFPASTASTSRPPGRVARWVFIGVAVAAAVVVTIVLLRRGPDDRPSSTVAGGPTTSAAPATTAAVPAAPSVAPSAALARQLRDAAAGIEGDGGPLAPMLVNRLRSVADEVEAGGGGGEAIAALVAVVGLNRSGELADGTASSVIRLLRQVPGVDQNVVDALTSSSSTGDAPEEAPNRNKGKGKED